VQLHDLKTLIDQDGSPGQQTQQLMMLEMLSHLVKVS
jgi:hypothetical protein